MDQNQLGVVRIQDRGFVDSRSPQKLLGELQATDKTPKFSENKTSSISAFNVIRKGFEKGSQAIKHLSLSPDAEKPFPEDNILDPQGPFLQKWNKFFLISCVIAVAIDALFLYIPVADGKKQRLELDDNMELIACFFRTLIDLFYLSHIILQFQTGFVSRCSLVLGRGELVRDFGAIARRYITSYFFVDIIAVLPIPQMAVLVIIPRMMGGGPLTSKGMLKLVISAQCIPRLIRIYPLYKEVTQTSGFITETSLGRAVCNLFLYMIAGHVGGAIWYMLAIDRQSSCWSKSCLEGCDHLSLYCKDRHERNYAFNTTYCNLVDPDQIIGSTFFNFGLFYDALQSEVIQSTNIFDKLFYFYWWGFRNLSCFGQNLKTSIYIWDNVFASIFSGVGLVLFSFFIGNMQAKIPTINNNKSRGDEMRTRRQDAELWMSHRMLPEDLRERIRRYEQYSWQVTRGVDEESVIRNLPRDLRRDIKRHLCLSLLMRVPMFAKMDEQLKDAMCDRLKPVLYTENSFIVREGDPVNEMLFIMRGNLLTMTTNGGRTGFFKSVFLKAGDFCGEGLLTWALDPLCSSNLPISTSTVLSTTEVEAFALTPDDLKFLASQFRRLHSRQLRHTFRFHSQQWRTWAACFIQAAWRRYNRRRLEKSLQEAEQNALAKGEGSSLSFGATIYASKFAINALRSVRRDRIIDAKFNLQKPNEPDFASQHG